MVTVWNIIEISFVFNKDRQLVNSSSQRNQAKVAGFWALVESLAARTEWEVHFPSTPLPVMTFQPIINQSDKHYKWKIYSGLT